MSQKEMNIYLEQYVNQYQEKMNFRRWQTFTNVRCHTDKIKKPQDLIKFSWETNDVDEDKITPAELEKRKENMLKLINT